MITVERAHLTKAIGYALPAMTRRDGIPVLGTLKAVANGSLSIEATDLNNFVAAEIPYEGDAGSFCIPEPRGLRAAFNADGGGQVRFSPGENGALGVSCGALQGDLKSLPAEDHPGAERICEELFGCDIGAAELRQLRRIMPAISTDGIRYYLNGVCVRRIGEWLYRFAATDGHRLMWVDIPLPGASGEIADGAIIDRRFLELAMAVFPKAGDAIRLSYGHVARRNERGDELEVENKGLPRVAFSAKIGDVRLTLTGKLIDGTYPDYARVVPTVTPHLIRARKADLERAIRSLTPLGTEKVRAIRLKYGKDGLTVSLDRADIGEARTRLEVDYSGPADVTLGFNAQYLLDMCGSLLGDEIELRFDDPAGPALIRDPADTEFCGVQMPMRV